MRKCVNHRVGQKLADAWLYAVSFHCPRLEELLLLWWSFTAEAIKAILLRCRQLRRLAHHAHMHQAAVLLACAECDAQIEDQEIASELLGEVT